MPREKCQHYSTNVHLLGYNFYGNSHSKINALRSKRKKKHYKYFYQDHDESSVAYHAYCFI